MNNIDSRELEKLISDLTDTKEIRRLINKYSKNRAFYYHALKDISKGRESSNYSTLNKVATKKKVTENFIIEQAKSVLSYIDPYDEPETDNYYEILDIPLDASEQKIRERWIELTKSHDANNRTQEQLEKSNKINEAYNVLSNRTKKINYDTKYPPNIPILVKEDGLSTRLRLLLYVVPFILVITVSYLYLSSSKSTFSLESDVEYLVAEIDSPDQRDISNGNLDNQLPDDQGKAETQSSLVKNELAVIKENHEIVDENYVEDNQTEVARIVEENDTEKQISEKEESDRVSSLNNQPDKLTTNYDPDLASPVLVINNPESRYNEFSPNMPIPDDDSLDEFVSQYVTAYKNRNLQAIRSLFAPNARENGVSIYKVLDTYESNFSTLDILTYDFEVKRSSIDKYTGVVMGNFNVKFSNPVNKLTKTSQGSISWLLRWRGHKWEIEEINYQIHGTDVINE